MNEPLNLDELDELEALAEAATPGPWDTDMVGYLARHPGVDGFAFPERAAEERDEIQRDKDFIVAARAAVPALVARVRALEDNHLSWLARSDDDVAAELADLRAKLEAAAQLADEWASWPNGHDANGPQDFASALRAIIQSDTGGTNQ